MAANLTAIFQLVDEISGKLDAIANSGNSVATQLQNAGNAADGAFRNATNGSARTAQSVDGVARSTSSMSGAMGAATSAVDGLNRSMESVDVSSGNVAESTDDLARATQEAGSAIDGAVSSTDALSAAIEGYDQSADEATRSTDELVGMSSRAEQAFGDQEQAAGEAADSMRELESCSEEAGESSSSAFETMQNALAAAGIAALLNEVVEGFVSAVKASIEFESAVTGIYKTVDGTAEQLKSISDETKLLSTVIPASTTEIAGVAEAAGQLGIATEDIMSFTEVIINLGEATNLSSEEAASSLAKFSNITGMTADNYENLGSTIVSLGNNFATTEADITAMAMRMASAGTLAGLTEPEILALAASLSSVGIEADAGGSSMSTMLTKMQLAVETGNEQLEQFAYVSGMSSEEFQKAWGQSAVDALYAFIEGLNDTERTGQTATVLLNEMGITEIRLSNAIKALASDSEGLSKAIGTANTAWASNTALSKEAATRYETLESKLKMASNATNNIGIAFGDVLTPAISNAIEGYTGVAKAITGFIQRHPAVVKAITAVGVAIGSATVAITGYIFVTKLAIPAIKAFGVALTANPIGAVVVGLVALTTAVATFITLTPRAEDELIKLTASSREQQKELEKLNNEYNKVCEKYGETSNEARYLAFEIENLSGRLEGSKQTFESYVEELDNTRQGVTDLLDANRDTFDGIKNDEANTLALAAKLEEFATQTERTTETQEQMKAIIDELNESIPGLALNYEDVAGGVTDFVKAVEIMAKAQANTNLYKAAQQGLVDALESEIVAENTLIKIEEERAIAQAEYEQEYENYLAVREKHLSWVGMGGKGIDPYEAEMNRANTAYKNAEEQLAKLDEQTQEYGETLTQAQTEAAAFSESLKEYAEYANGVIDTSSSYSDAISNAIVSVQADIDALAQTYDAAYVAVRENLNGTVGLFQQVEEQAGLSTERIIEAWQSQIDFFNEYRANLSALEEVGIDSDIIKQLADGSTESIGQVKALADELSRLDPSEAQTTVDAINAKFGELTEAKDTAAATMTAIQTDFNSQLDQIEIRLAKTVENMNMGKEAEAAARDTMSAYIQAIKAKQSSAVSAAEAVAAAVSLALSRTRTPTIGGSAGTVSGHAAGTTDAPENVFVAGENGPELIIGGKGSAVFPSDETNRIISAIDEMGGRGKRGIQNPTTYTAYTLPLNDGNSRVTQVPDAFESSKPDSTQGSQMTKEKKILLEIAGSGRIDIGKNVDKSTVIDLLYDYLKPVLSDILKQEMYEEGERSYAY